ncbi:MAG: DNA polymerase III subunit delta [Pirellulales bacterium]
MAKAAKKSRIDALEYLAHPENFPVAGACAVFGDDAFLKSEVLIALRHQVLAGAESDFGLTIFTGRDANLRDIHDALATASLFGTGARLVIVEDADTFVTANRSELEDFVAQPLRGNFVLEVKTWPANTRLAKEIAASGTSIDCRSLESLKGPEIAKRKRDMQKWLIERAKKLHNTRLEPAAVDALIELVPPEPGILYQEVARLALLTNDARTIDAALVQANVGGWRTRATWDMVDAAADGRAAEALAQLDRLISSGEKAQGLLPQMAASLRKFSAAIELVEAAEAERRRLPASEALAQAGVPKFKLGDAEHQLRQLGRRRARQITPWLLAADLALKSHNSRDERARIELERLIVNLRSLGNAGEPRAPAATRR